MNGLDKLKSKIANDAEKAAAEIISNAEKKARETAEEAKIKAEAAAGAIMEEADKRAMIIVRSAESNANLDGKKKILVQKRKAIESAFAEAAKSIRMLGENEYFEIIYSLASKADGGGQLLMSKNDKGRMPKNFAEKISEISDGKITVSEEYADIENGFILRSESVEENCSFDAIIEANAEKLQDITAKLLFS